jgi:lipoate-protein ligase A
VMKEWFYWPFAVYDGRTNMAIDLYLATNYAQIIKAPLIRFYGWEPACISLGKNQHHSDIDLTLCQQMGIDVVYRPSGGRAILHAQELTYAIVAPLAAISREALYIWINELFASVLASFGLTVEKQSRQTDFRHFYRSSNSAATCFSAAAQHELLLAGKKILGSAQRLLGNVILQHGSLMLGAKHRDIIDFLHLEGVKKKNLKEKLRDTATELSAFTLPTPSAEIVSEKICNTMEQNGQILVEFERSNEVLMHCTNRVTHHA